MAPTQAGGDGDDDDDDSAQATHQRLWARRPLTAEMKLYAVEDVMHLLQLRFAMLYEMTVPVREEAQQVVDVHLRFSSIFRRH